MLFIYGLPLIIWRNPIKMFINKVAILFPLFIFGITTQALADAVKSINIDANQVKIMKMHEDNSVMQNKVRTAKEPDGSLKPSESTFQPETSDTDRGPVTDITKPSVIFSKTLKKSAKLQWASFLDKVIYSYVFFDNAWRDRFLTLRGVLETKSSGVDYGKPALKPFPNENEVGERRIWEAFEFLQPKREEIFKEMFIGFRFSFYPMSGHMLLFLNATPSSDNELGLMIPF
jgi:hypothetical protein